MQVPMQVRLRRQAWHESRFSPLPLVLRQEAMGKAIAGLGGGGGRCQPELTSPDPGGATRDGFSRWQLP